MPSITESPVVSATANVMDEGREVFSTFFSSGFVYPKVKEKGDQQGWHICRLAPPAQLLLVKFSFLYK